MKERNKQKPAVDFSAEITSPEELLVFVHFLRSVYEQEWQRVGEALIALIEQYLDEHPTLRQPATNGGRA